MLQEDIKLHCLARNVIVYFAACHSHIIVVCITSAIWCITWNTTAHDGFETHTVCYCCNIA